MSSRPGTLYRERPVNVTGQPLTDEERVTLQAFLEVGPVINAAAEALVVHVNTVKYRVDRIRMKYGLKERVAPHRVFVEGLKRGDIVIGNTAGAIVAGFERRLLNGLPAIPLRVHLERWIHQTADDYLQDVTSGGLQAPSLGPDGGALASAHPDLAARAEAMALEELRPVARQLAEQAIRHAGLMLAPPLVHVPPVQS